MSFTRKSAWAVGDETAADRNFVVVASRLPVDRIEGPDGETVWRPSPGGLVTALEPVMREAGGAWIGWSGDAGPEPGPFEADGLHLIGIGLSETEVRDYYEGFCNATLWPLYHDVIAPPKFHRRWWEAYVAVNRRFAQAAAAQAAPGATVWVHDYQLQLVPQMLRRERGDVRIGFFNHIPFPGYEIFAQLPWRRQVVEGLLGADLLGFQRRADASNFLRACRRAAALTVKGPAVRVSDPEGTREVRAAAFPISVDAKALTEIAQREDVRKRSQDIRQALGEPELFLLGVDRLDYTKGILHRLRAYGELLNEGRLGSQVVLVQVASPSRERVEAYRALRDEVEVMVGRINGQHAEVGFPPVHYLHQSYPREEMAALYLAADVMLVTPLRDGMNLVAKEYVACRYDESGTLVLSEFTGAADELAGAFLVNPHDIEGLKDAIVRAATVSPQVARRRMRSMRRRVCEHDVARWAETFLAALDQESGELTTADLEMSPGLLTGCEKLSLRSPVYELRKSGQAARCVCSTRDAAGVWLRAGAAFLTRRCSPTGASFTASASFTAVVVACGRSGVARNIRRSDASIVSRWRCRRARITRFRAARASGQADAAGPGGATRGVVCRGSPVSPDSSGRGSRARSRCTWSSRICRSRRGRSA